MVTQCRPVGAALPPRRDALVKAAEAPISNDWSMSINVPRARDRMLEYFEREQLPGEVKSTLAAALNGDLHYQHLLFTAMIDTWPKLQKNIEEVARLVSVAPWKIHPYAARGEKPLPKNEKDAKEIESLVWGMKPRVAWLEKGLEDTIKDLVRGHYYGHVVSEVRWDRDVDGRWKPRCTKAVPARFYGYPYDIMADGNGEDRLMFDPAGGMSARQFQDFPDHRFLIGIHAGHSGHPSVAAPLRALAGYWLAAVYGLKWFLNFTQLYGIPWRHAEVGDIKDENAVKSALANIGANGYIVTKPNTKINILSDASTSGQSLPQRELIALADQQCDQMILGQTLTSSVSTDGGSRALGEVHQGTLDGVVDGVADWVGGILTHQLIPAVVAVNYGESIGNELPEMWAKREKAKDRKSASENLEAAKRIGMPVGRQFGYEEMGIPIPAADEDLLFEPAAQGQPEVVPPIVAPNGAPGDPVPPGKAPGHETKAKAQVQAADAEKPLTVDQLSESVLEGLTGVSREWLSPVRPFFDRLAALAMSKQVTDEDFLAALEKAQKQLPEIFDLMDTDSLQRAFENAIGSGVLAGSVSRYE